MSTIFPKGILIGRIADFSKNPLDNSYLIDVELFTDMSSIEHVYLIKNYDRDEISAIENRNLNE